MDGCALVVSDKRTLVQIEDSEILGIRRISLARVKGRGRRTGSQNIPGVWM